MLYIDDPDKVPLQLLLVRTLGSIEFITSNSEFSQQLGIDLSSFPNNSARMAIAVLAGGPMLIIFPFFQRFFVKGLTVGSLRVNIQQTNKHSGGHVMKKIIRIARGHPDRHIRAFRLRGSGGKSDTGSGTTGTQGSTPEASGASGLEPAELTWYYPPLQLQPDQKKVEEEINKIVKEKLNATVKLMPVAIGDYVQKMNTVLAAGEKFDILWTGYMLKPEELVRKGLFNR